MSTSETQSFAAHAGYVLRQNPVTMGAFAMLAVLIVCAIFGPSLVPYDPFETTKPRPLVWYGSSGA